MEDVIEHDRESGSAEREDPPRMGRQRQNLRLEDYYSYFRIRSPSILSAATNHEIPEFPWRMAEDVGCALCMDVCSPWSSSADGGTL